MSRRADSGDLQGGTAPLFLRAAGDIARLVIGRASANE
jgi:hypothetical protein